MFPVSISFLLAVLLETAFIGLILGVGSAVAASVILKLRVWSTAIVIDALLGITGTFTVVAILPPLGFDGRFAMIAAVLVVAGGLPVLHQFVRFKRLGHGERQKTPAS